MWTQNLKTSMNNHRGRLAIVVVCLLATSSSGAQLTEQTESTRPIRRTGVSVKTGLMNYITGDRRMIAATVTEVGAPTAESQVMIAFFGPGDSLIARHEGVLTREHEVTFALPLDMVGPLALVRTEFTIVGRPNRRSAPVVALEDIDPLGLTIEPRIYCAPPTSQSFDLPEPMCPPGVVNSFVVGQ